MGIRRRNNYRCELCRQIIELAFPFGESIWRDARIRDRSRSLLAASKADVLMEMLLSKPLAEASQTGFRLAIPSINL